MEQLETQVQGALIKSLNNIKTQIGVRMGELKRTASGRSVSSLSVTLEAMNKGYLEGDQQWQVMQRGRAAGKGPYNFREIIKDWIKAKGITITPRRNETQESAMNTAAYLITRNILKNGTALHRAGGYNDIYDSVVEEELTKMENEIGGFFEADVDEINSLFIRNDNKDNK